ncbi:UvrD-helicase domain-containing protein [Bacillus swezeyi]|uniref:UvrD-helicase domain-containing protein n=1 Tax=Bacillus swezeyi TaxID=1925020 RepID=UPI002E2470F0|nr:UvrD-helicase domain-containing protein [Bacillus swezeyi]
MIEITDGDIDSVESILLPQGKKFDEDHRKVIKNLHTIDIKACPGSGKTTALVAKLLILEKKLPFKNNQGICVLTHTNVGVNEIKEKSSIREGGKLFQYPNHVSTIQVFVNKYLAIPSYKHFYKDSVYSIDQEGYNESFDRLFLKIPWKYRTNINRKYKTEYLCNNLNLSVENGTDIYIRNRKLSDVYSKTTATYNYLYELKKCLFDKGILSYHDTYVLALKFLREFPEAKNLISARFKFLFIDEMQDTSGLQMELIKSVFNQNQVSIQCIGDENQAIFENSRGESGWEPKEKPILLSESKRFSKSIAECVDKICDKPQNIKGNQYINNIPPTILVYNDSSIKKVLTAFCKLIIRNNLHKKDGNTFKAVGRVTKVHNEGHITIPSYFPSYLKFGKERYKNSYECLDEYLQAISQFEDFNVEECRKLIINCLLHTLRIEDVRIDDKWLTEKIIFEKLKDTNSILITNLTRHIASWILKIRNGEFINCEVAKFIIEKFIPFFKGNKHISSQLKEFCTKEVSKTHKKLSFTQLNNAFIYNDEKDEVVVTVDTVHNVKGETHTGTLYLETYFKQYDLKRIMEYLKKKHTPPKSKELREALNIVYVGLTRPTNLLCLAMRQETIKGNEDELKEAGWEIRYLTEEH